jgi:uncharacterized protein YbcI
MFAGDNKNRLEKEIRKRMKDTFGKGPVNIEIMDYEKATVVILNGILTKVEKLRMEESGGIEGVRNFRYEELRKTMENILSDRTMIRAVVEKMYIDVNANDDMACITIYK